MELQLKYNIHIIPKHLCIHQIIQGQQVGLRRLRKPSLSGAVGEV